MSCFFPKDIAFPSLPGFPSIKIPNSDTPNLRATDTSYSALGLPGIFLNWHPNLCDLLILIYILYLLLQDPGSNPNPTLEETQAWITSITSGSDYFGESNDVDGYTSPANVVISIKSFRAKVYPQDRDLIMQSIYDNFDSNNDFSNKSDNEVEAIFELNNLSADDIPTYYELKKTQFTRNVKLTRV